MVAVLVGVYCKEVKHKWGPGFCYKLQMLRNAPRIEEHKYAIGGLNYHIEFR